jgi:hypothetical protein
MVEVFDAQGVSFVAVTQQFNTTTSMVQRSVGGPGAVDRLTGRYVRRVMRLALRAPRIVEAIAEGRQPTDLTTLAMTQRIELPPLWTAQEQALDIRLT